MVPSSQRLGQEQQLDMIGRQAWQQDHRCLWLQSRRGLVRLDAKMATYAARLLLGNQLSYIFLVSVVRCYIHSHEGTMYDGTVVLIKLYNIIEY